MNNTARPYKVTDSRTGRIVASTTSYRRAQVAVARRIASDVEGRVLIIDGPEGRTICRNNGLTIRYTEAA
jgi:hypothetical protein